MTAIDNEVWVLVYSHGYGVDVSVHATEASVLNAVRSVIETYGEDEETLRMAKTDVVEAVCRYGQETGESLDWELKPVQNLVTAVQELADAVSRQDR